MKLLNASIQNFRGIEQIDLEFDPTLNVLIGENGSGKTVILEALTIAVGSYMIGLRDVPTRGISDDDVRYTSLQEYAYPVVIKASGIVNDQSVEWSRERNSQRGSTTSKNAKPIN